MSRIFAAVTDAMLQRMVPTVVAGACVPNVGQICCHCCKPTGQPATCFRYNCNGVCAEVSGGCC